MKLSIFEVDRTLTRRPTYSAFLLYAAWTCAPWRLALIPLILGCGLCYAARLLPRKRMKEIMQRCMLGPIDRHGLEQVAATFARHLHSHGLYEQAHRRILEERAAGRTVMLATAAPLYYVEPLAAHLGVDWVVATRSCWQGDRLLPGIDGENCYGPSKRDSLCAFLEARSLLRSDVHIRFFSDHISDRPTFDWADEAIAVNPSRKLLRHARLHGWTILDWRKAADAAPAR